MRFYVFLPKTKSLQHQAVAGAVSLSRLGWAGLLVHSACLLSTSGNEDAMLDDFAGA